MKKIIFYVCVVVSMLACNTVVKTDPPVPATTQTGELAGVSVKHVFSDPVKEDVFTLTLSGDSLLAAMVTFEIIDHSGKRIHLDTFPARYLLNYGVPDGATAADKKAFIRKRIQEFFSAENFLSPAIKTGETFDNDYAPAGKEIWDEIKSDSTAVGFDYLVAEEDGKRIAFSRKLKKVVLYYNCC